MKKSITENERLQAFALYTMANQHYAKVREFERGIARILGDDEDYNDSVSDAIYANEPGAADDFDYVLDRAGVSVKKAAKRKKALKR